MADFLHSNELYFIEALTDITQKMKNVPFPPWTLSQVGQ